VPLSSIKLVQHSKVTDNSLLGFDTVYICRIK